MRTIKIEQEHAAMVAKLRKPGKDLLETLTPEKADLMHMAIGLASEAGEILDVVKRHVIYNKPFDRENMVEELGDSEFYMEGLREIIEASREETLEHNLNKLSTGQKARYKDGYSDQAARDRADKVDVSEDLSSQIDRLAKTIMGLDIGEPSRDEGAVDCAIRMLKDSYGKSEKAA